MDQILVTLGDVEFEQFLALLDAPPSSNLGLERLLAVRPPWSLDTLDGGDSEDVG